MTDTTFSILRTKLKRPRLAEGLVIRPRLLDQLNQTLGKQIALISAPAGFGKTTLLCQWLEQCPLPNAWLQLDENDSELSFFIAGVISALRQIFPTACPESAKLVLASQPAPHAAWVNALLSDIEALGERPFVLALDDFHLLHNPNIDLLLADILQHAPLSLHLMIAARRSPSLAFSRLKVQENAVEIRTADLRFNNVEAASFFDQAIAAPLKEEALLQLQLKVEGWAAGLTLAAISMREETSPEDLIMRLDGSHRRVSDYLLDQALNDQPLEIQDYLLKSSFLNRFCAPLCQAVMDAPITPAQSQTLLEQIERSQLFLIPLDDQRHWYRYHHLFQKMLYAHMQLYQSPQEIEQLRRRAAKWLEGEGLFDEAIEQLTILQDWANAARLVERGLCNQLNREDRRGIQRRLERFPPEFIQTRPGLLLMQAWIAHFDLQIARISRLTDQIQEILDNIITGSGNERMEPVQTGFEEMSPAVIQAQVQILRSLACYQTNRGSEGASLARQALIKLPMDWAFVRGLGKLYLGLCMQMEGQGKEAIQLISQEYETSPERRSQYGVRLLFCLSTIYFQMGDLERCRQTSELLLEDAQAAGLLLLQGWGHYLLGRACLEWNELELAAGRFATLAEQRYTVNLICVQDGLACWMHALLALGQPERARQVMELFGQLQKERVGPPGEALLSLQAWLDLLAGDRDAARSWAESFDPPAAGQSLIWFQLAQVFKVRILIELGEPATAQSIGSLLDALQGIAEKTHNIPLTIRLLALRSLWLEGQGRRSAALETLQHAVQIARPGRFMRPFLDYGLQMSELLQQLREHGKGDAGLVDAIQTILAAFPNRAPVSPPKAANRPEASLLLTDREVDVLKLLAQRLSIKEIAANLFISPSTVRQHTIHIYRKLGVSGKREAVAAAQELGLTHL